jgi:hypothetical protein
MAGQAQRGSRDRGPSSRRGWVAAPAAEPSAAGSGSEPITPVSPGDPSNQALALGTSATPSPWAVWHLIQMKGMSPDEAANLTAFLYGLPTADLRWSLPQLNQLLFLRRLRQAGRFGRTDGGAEPTT